MNEPAILEQLDSLKRIAEGIQAALMISNNKSKTVIGQVEPFFQDAVDLLTDQIGGIDEWAPKMIQAGPGQCYDLLFRYQSASTLIFLRALEMPTGTLGFLVLFINPRVGELPTIRGLSNATVRKLNKIIKGQ